MEILFGIDIGTTNVKNIAFNKAGQVEAQVSFSTPSLITTDGVHAVDTDALWRALVGSFVSVTDTLKTKYHDKVQYSGIAITGMAETGVLLGADDRELYPAILWNDLCTAGMQEIWHKDFGKENVIRITGQFAQHNYSATRFLWMEKNIPGILSKAGKWLCMPDYIAYKLTGECVMDYSLACRTMLLDVNTLSWSEEICKYVGVDSGILPQLKPSGSLIGKISGEIAKLTGLPEGLGVYAGGHDHICAAFACGIDSNSTVLDSSGTSEQFLTIAAPSAVKKLTSLGFNTGVFASPDKRYLAGALGSSGKVVDWFKRITSGGNGSMDMSSDGIIFRPYLDGGPSPARDLTLTASFSGLKSTHTYENLLQAVYEGLSFEAGKILFTISENPNKIILVGGGSRNTVWQQIKADVFDLPLIIPKNTEATALGAAIMAGIGCGLYKDHSDALSHTFAVDRIITPQAPDKYRELYKKYFEE